MMIPCIFLTKTISSKLFLAPNPNRESELDVSSSGIGWLRCPQCPWIQQPQGMSVAGVSQAAQPVARAGVEPAPCSLRS